MRITVLLRSFTRGGAERQAAVAAASLARRGHEVEVVVFRDGPAYQDELGQAGLRPVALDGPRALLPLAFVRHVRRRRPDVVLSYLPGPNLVATCARLAPGRRPGVVWGIRATDLRLDTEHPLARLVGRVEPMASRWCDVAVANAAAARSDAQGRGVRPRRFDVVPNTVDTDRWVPDPGARAARRMEWGVGPDVPVVGRVGRLHPMKDVPSFLSALARVRRDRPDAVGVVAGTGDAATTTELRAVATRLGLDRAVTWLGDVDDARGLYPGFDVAVSSSAWGEAFPNVVAEALACGVPCVGTDVGATAELLDDPRWVVPPGDPDALAGAIERVLALDPVERSRVSGRGRDRVRRWCSPESTTSALEESLAAAVQLAREGSA